MSLNFERMIIDKVRFDKREFVFRSPVLFIFYLFLLALPCCFKWDADAFHFAKFWLFTGILSSICIATVLYMVSVNRRWLRYLMIGILVFLYFAEFFVFQHLHSRVNDKILFLVLQTNSRECGEFLSTYLLRKATIVPVIATAIIIALYILAKKYLDKPVLLSRKMMITIIIVNILSFSVFAVRTFTDLFFFKLSSPTIVQLYKSIRVLNDYSVDIKLLENAIDKADGEFIDNNESHPHIIFIIGESLNPNHTPFYGYRFNTMPNMMKENERGNVVVFDDAVTASNATSNVMDFIFSTSPSREGKDRWHYPIFPMIFKNAGYKVNYMDNQQTQTLGIVGVDYQFFNSEKVVDASLDYRNPQISGYDMDFVIEQLKNIPDYGDHPVLDIYHINGQHSPAVRRYPASCRFPVFDYSYRSDLNDAQKEVVRQYDMAVMYNDEVIARIIECVKDTDTILLFLSDHGEEIYDYRDQYGRTNETPTSGIAKNIYHVPMFVYTTPQYRARHPEKYQEIVAASAKPLYTPDISQMLFHIAGIRSKYADASRDPLSPAYISKGRRILGEEVDYDELMKN